MQGFQYASSSIAPTRYPDIDALLGNKEDRYFGQGFKQVGHQLINQSFNTVNRQLTADIRIDYPAHWSRKGLYPMKPHLSTIDAMWLNCCACETLLAACYKRTAGSIPPLIRRVDMKAGTQPLESLSAIPLSVKLNETHRRGEFRRFQSHFQARIGGMSLDTVIEHDGQWRDSPLPAELDFQTSSDKPYSRQCQRATRADASHNLTQLVFSDHDDQVRANYSSDTPSADGTEFLAPIEVILVLGQLAQALIYRKDGITRETSSTLWMRSVVLENTTHFHPHGDNPAHVWLDWHRTLKKSNESWRVFRLQGTLGSSRGLFSLAYRLPDTHGEDT